MQTQTERKYRWILAAEALTLALVLHAVLLILFKPAKVRAAAAQQSEGVVSTISLNRPSLEKLVEAFDSRHFLRSDAPQGFAAEVEQLRPEREIPLSKRKRNIASGAQTIPEFRKFSLPETVIGNPVGTSFELLPKGFTPVPGDWFCAKGSGRREIPLKMVMPGNFAKLAATALSPTVAETYISGGIFRVRLLESCGTPELDELALRALLMMRGASERVSVYWNASFVNNRREEAL